MMRLAPLLALAGLGLAAAAYSPGKRCNTDMDCTQFEACKYHPTTKTKPVLRTT